MMGNVAVHNRSNDLVGDVTRPTQDIRLPET
jgi:hypothetical protein